jgi:hypothetical protein
VPRSGDTSGRAESNVEAAQSLVSGTISRYRKSIATTQPLLRRGVWRTTSDDRRALHERAHAT